MDVMYPLCYDSRCGDAEIKYSLRSLEKYFPVDNIFIVGQMPSFIHNVNFIPFDDVFCKEKNIMLKIKEVCKREISEQFLFMNDDHFLSYKVKDIPYYYDMELSNVIARKNEFSNYTSSLKNTLRALQEKKLSTYHFDIHTPIVYDKIFFPEIMKLYDWEIPHGYTVKSLYGNTLDVKREKVDDVKVSCPMNRSELLKMMLETITPFFSVGEGGMNEIMLSILQEIYPTPSRWE